MSNIIFEKSFIILAFLSIAVSFVALKKFSALHLHKRFRPTLMARVVFLLFSLLLTLTVSYFIILMLYGSLDSKFHSEKKGRSTN